MRRNRATSLALLGVLAASAGLARDALALTACTAAQISSQDPTCPSGTGPCVISRDFTVPDGCILDFGTRAVTVGTGGKLLTAPGSVTIRGGSLTVAGRGFIDARGLAAPVDRGGLVTIQTTGAVDIQKTGSDPGRINVSGDLLGGTLKIEAGGSVTIAGEVNADNLSGSAAGGSIVVDAVGDIVTLPGSVVSAQGGTGGSGRVDLSAGGRVNLGETVDIRGDEGGELDVSSGSEAVVRRVRGDASGDAGSGGCVMVTGGTRVDLLGVISLTGSSSIDGTTGGCGGAATFDAQFGDVTVTSGAQILAEGAGPDGGGGEVDLSAAGSVVVQIASIASARSNGGQGCGGMICIDGQLGMTNSGTLDVSGGLGGGTVDISSAANVTLGGTITAAAFSDGGFAGDVTAEAGFDGAGALSISGTIDVTGGHCSVLNGCGDGGTTDLSGCDVTLTPTGHLLAVAPNAGQNRLTAREQLTVAGEANASAVGAGTVGTNLFEHPSRKPPILGGVVTPPASVTPFATCTGPLQPLCLDPCPTCGNGTVEWPESCDTLGPPVSCDGCSRFCRVENCSDTNVCTTDSCDPTLGCRHVAVPDRTACPDGLVCNGDELCFAGVCVAGVRLNCNDNNACTADPCVEPGGCTHTPEPVGAPCTDNNACTVGDACNGAGACQTTGPLICDDGAECTVDTCNPANGCVFTNRTGNCTDEGNACTTDVCSAGVCTHPSRPDGTACDDGAFCTINDTCQTGACSPGPPRNCADTNPCTADRCDEVADACMHDPLPAGSACSDNNACTVGDACDGAGVCQTTGPLICDDTKECTVDTCNTVTGCVFTNRTGACTDDGNACTTDVCGGGLCTHPARPNGTACDDGLFCTVTDTCQGGVCSPGPARSCPDTNVCTTDRCDEALDACMHDPITPCCGNGVPEPPGEDCDDGNSSNTDACLNTCRAARCGDGFVRTGIEQCDLGTGNADTPNAGCRTDCRLPRCGDGIVDTSRGEQCDDGGAVGGDGCSAGCFIEPPATAVLIAGKGSAFTDCASEWLMDHATFNRKGQPDTKQSCRDGDVACDFGTTPGECLFHVWLCANNHDTRLPFCTPGPSGTGTVVQVDLQKPSSKDGTRRAEDSQNRSQLLAAGLAAQTSAFDQCGPRMALRVPLKSPSKAGSKKLKLKARTTTGAIDADGLGLICNP